MSIGTQVNQPLTRDDERGVIIIMGRGTVMGLSDPTTKVNE